MPVEQVGWIHAPKLEMIHLQALPATPLNLGGASSCFSHVELIPFPADRRGFSSCEPIRIFISRGQLGVKVDIVDDEGLWGFW